MSRVSSVGGFAFVAALLAAVALAVMAQGCASTSSYLEAHPDVAKRVALALELAQCADKAVEAYPATSLSPLKLDPNPYVPAPEPADAGVPTWFSDGGHG